MTLVYLVSFVGPPFLCLLFFKNFIFTYLFILVSPGSAQELFLAGSRNHMDARDGTWVGLVQSNVLLAVLLP